MCGRYALTLPPEAVRRLFGYREQPNFPPRYNIAPTQPVAVVRQDATARHFLLMRWGFLPGWVKDPKDFPLVINIRSETVADKPAFRAAFRRRRALLPADGFYEWQRLGKERRPFLLRRPDRAGFAFAALWETWSGADGSEVDTVAMLTTGANAVMAPIHHRCPVILDAQAQAVWLDPEATPDQTARLLQPPPDDALEAVRIGAAVNKVGNDGPEIQQPLAPDTSPPPDVTPAEPARAPRSRRGQRGDQGSLF